MESILSNVLQIILSFRFDFQMLLMIILLFTLCWFFTLFCRLYLYSFSFLSSICRWSFSDAAYDHPCIHALLVSPLHSQLDQVDLTWHKRNKGTFGLFCIILRFRQSHSSRNHIFSWDLYPILLYIWTATNEILLLKPDIALVSKNQRRSRIQNCLHHIFGQGCGSFSLRNSHSVLMTKKDPPIIFGHLFEQIQKFTWYCIHH